jgi:hypothetical protein
VYPLFCPCTGRWTDTKKCLLSGIQTFQNINNKLQKDEAWEDTKKAMRTVSEEWKKKVTSLLSSSEEREEEYGKAVVQERVCMYVLS